MRHFGKGLLKGLAAILVIAPMATVFGATSVSDIGHSAAADGAVKITLQTSGDTPQVSVFATDNPPRIVLDMSDTENNAGTDTIRVGAGAVQQYSAVGAGGRTRLVVDLAESVAYDYSADGGQVVLMVGGGSQAAAQAGSTVSTGGPAVNGVDFRLGESGQARIIVSMDRPGVSMSIEEGANALTVDIFGARLPESLDQRLDVMDFATPVQFIDSYNLNSGVRLDLRTTGLYEHLAYESGNDLVIEVSQLSRTAEV